MAFCSGRRIFHNWPMRVCFGSANRVGAGGVEGSLKLRALGVVSLAGVRAEVELGARDLWASDPEVPLLATGKIGRAPSPTPVEMGSTQSVSGTPARPLPRNKQVARVADPRSPSAGIQRTPIQVESSPQPSLPAEQLNSLKQAQDPDPRSPTLGIARTPMKISGPDPQCSLVKELSEVFETEASESISSPKLALPRETPLSSDLDLSSDPQLSPEDQLLPWSQAELYPKQVFTKEEAKQSAETIAASQNSDKPSRDPETPQSSGSKRSRRKANSKVLGRSPLTILQDDNSPGTLTLRQGKRPSALSENVKDLKEGVVLGTGRFLKAGGGAREPNQDHDKENQHFALLES